MKDVEIIRLINITENDVIDLSKLISQLEGTEVTLSKKQLEEVIQSDNNIVFIAKLDGNIIGTFTLVIYRIITGLKASVEDVVVDSSLRGKGLGGDLLRFAIDYAKSIGVMKLDLTSRPTRIAANALYQKVGFQLRDTNVYRIEL